MKSKKISRRDFLQFAGVGAFALLGGRWALSGGLAP